MSPSFKAGGAAGAAAAGSSYNNPSTGGVAVPSFLGTATFSILPSFLALFSATIASDAGVLTTSFLTTAGPINGEVEVPRTGVSPALVEILADDLLALTSSSAFPVGRI